MVEEGEGGGGGEWEEEEVVEGREGREGGMVKRSPGIAKYMYIYTHILFISKM